VKRLTVIYDASCGFCVRCRDWLERQPSYVPLELVWSGSPEVARRFPGLVGPGPAELLCVSDAGAVWSGAHAWLVCLWALRDWREWSLRLAKPELLPLARSLFELVSEKRGFLSRVLGLKPRIELMRVAKPAASRELVPRRAPRTRCAYCHEETAADASSCPHCRGILHETCRDELGRCATLGCRGNG
jgi:hypothetical protein